MKRSGASTSGACCPSLNTTITSAVPLGPSVTTGGSFTCLIPTTTMAGVELNVPSLTMNDTMRGEVDGWSAVL